jgi:hypothetical protein
MSVPLTLSTPFCTDLRFNQSREYAHYALEHSRFKAASSSSNCRSSIRYETWPRRYSISMAWSTISSKVAANPPCLCGVSYSVPHHKLGNVHFFSDTVYILQSGNGRGSRLASVSMRVTMHTTIAAHQGTGKQMTASRRFMPLTGATVAL